MSGKARHGGTPDVSEVPAKVATRSVVGVAQLGKVRVKAAHYGLVLGQVESPNEGSHRCGCAVEQHAGYYRRWLSCERGYLKCDL